MPGKISELNLLADPADGDMVEVLDVSDTSEAPTGTNKRMPLSSFAAVAIAVSSTPPANPSVNDLWVDTT